jgi:hypothetical protein
VQGSQDGVGRASDLCRLREDHTRGLVVVDGPQVLMAIEFERPAFQLNLFQRPGSQRVSE